MESAGIATNAPIVAALIGIVILQFFLRRRRKPEETHPDIVKNLLAETRMNQALADVLQQQEKPRKFLATSWHRNRTKLDFLNEALQGIINDAFMMAEDFNEQITMAKKYRSSSYTTTLNAVKLKELMTKSREGLEAWLSKNAGQKEPPVEYPRVFDGLFGR